MRKLTTALVSAATAAALALSIAPTAVAQSAFSLSSSGSKPAPSGPKNPTPTPKPDNSTEAKVKAIENLYAAIIEKSGATRTAAFDKAAQAGLAQAKKGDVEFFVDAESDYGYYTENDGKTGYSYHRFPHADIDLELYDDKEFRDYLAEEVEPEDQIDQDFGLAVGADAKYIYIVLVGELQYDPEEY